VLYTAVISLLCTACSGLLGNTSSGEPRTAVLHLRSTDLLLTDSLSASGSIFSRTVRPSGTTLTVDHYHIAGTGPDSAVYSDDFTGAIDGSDVTVTTAAMPVGPWTMTITALNSAGTILLTGAADITISPVSQADADVALSRPSGTGTVDITVNFGSDVTLTPDDSNTALTIEDSAGTKKSVSFTKNDTIPVCFTYTAELNAGDYTFTAVFKDSVSGKEIPFLETVQVFKDCTSTVSCTYDESGFEGGSTAVQGVYLSAYGTVPLLEGGTTTLAYTINPTNAADTAVTWASSDTAVAAVDTSGTVTALKAGTAVISVTTEDGSFSDRKKIRVLAASTLVDAVPVAGGTYTMGSGSDSNNPAHTVTVHSFLIGKYEVTQKVYKSVVGSNPVSSSSSYGYGDSYPVYNVNWYAAVKFCNLLSIKESLTPVYSIDGVKDPAEWGMTPTGSDGRWDRMHMDADEDADGYRLPTEAEWEYAASGGLSSSGYMYAGSNTINDVAWYAYSPASGTNQTGGKAANELGIYDMSGNVWEWCWDWYSNSYYADSADSDPAGPSSGSYRVSRGGSWGYSGEACCISYRNADSPSCSDNYHGFRVVRSVR